jgi:hypothetical protein
VIEGELLRRRHPHLGKYKVVEGAVIAVGVLPNLPFEYDPSANATLDSLSRGCGLR